MMLAMARATYLKKEASIMMVEVVLVEDSGRRLHSCGVGCHLQVYGGDDGCGGGGCH